MVQLTSQWYSAAKLQGLSFLILVPIVWCSWSLSNVIIFLSASMVSHPLGFASLRFNSIFVNHGHFRISLVIGFNRALFVIQQKM